MKSSMLVGLLMALTTVWFQITGYNPAFTPSSVTHLVLGIPFEQMAYEMSALVSAALCFSLYRIIQRHAQLLAAVITVTTVTASGLFVIASYQTLFVPEFLRTLSAFGMGVSFVWARLVLMMLARETGSMWEMAQVVTVSYFVAVPFSIAICMITHIAVLTAIVFLVTIAIALLIWQSAIVLRPEFTDHLNLQRSLKAVTGSSLARSQLLTILVIALAVTLMRAISSVGFWGSVQMAPPTNSSLILTTAATAAAAAVSLFVHRLYFKQKRQRWLQLPFLVLIAALFALLLLRLGFHGSLAYRFLETSVEVFCQMTTNLAILTLVRRSLFPPARVIALNMALCFFFAIVWLLMPDTSSLVVNAVILVTAYLLTIAVSTQQRSGEQESGGKVDRDESFLYGMLNSRSRDLAADAGLSRRETEVLLLLAQGRSLPYIMEKLTIAGGTARTHIKHIYEKLQVHSKQELLDLLNE
jgi:DNA-binding CsgD family transcriptional regulator